MRGKLTFLSGQERVQVRIDQSLSSKAFPVAQLPDSVLEELKKHGATGIAVEIELQDNRQPVIEGGRAHVWLPGGRRQPYTGKPQYNPETTTFRVTGVRFSEERGKRVLHFESVPTPDERKASEVTDPALGYANGNQLVLDGGYKVSQFGRAVPFLDGKSPSIDQNPYNFVALADVHPWEHPTDSDHGEWKPSHASGVLEFDAVALTPFFIPEGFPFDAGADRGRGNRLRSLPRHFCRMKDCEGVIRYAIPGASLKGVLRSGVEALANSRFGTANVAMYNKPIPYRRRVFKCGVLRSTGGRLYVDEGKIAYLHRNDWPGPVPNPVRFRVEEDRRHRWFAKPDNPTDIEIPQLFHGNLLAAGTTKPYTHYVFKKMASSYLIPDAVVHEYQSNIEHSHYETHLKNHGSTYVGVADIEQARNNLKQLQDGMLIYFTIDPSAAVDSFGKNVNYLWPARYSVEQLAGPFFATEQRGLGSPLGLADTLFGFSARHKSDSQPVRGKVRLETLWGDAATSYDTEASWPQSTANEAHKGLCLRLAPLTAPTTRAKARPLYLEGRNGVSASYSDSTPPMLKGRKFYWHQNADGAGGLWSKHLYDDNLHQLVADQCPPPLLALKPGSHFQGRIHFENLSDEELGVLLYALAGDPTRPGSHAIKVGKGKPRGLGSMAISNMKITCFAAAERYKSLNTTTDNQDRTSDRATFVRAFQKWCLKQSRSNLAFPSLPHIQDYDQLHAWPSTEEICYYPVNFSQYSWLPNDGRNPDEPRDRSRPPAMRRSRELRRITKNTNTAGIF